MRDQQQETRTVLPLIAEGEDTFIPLWEFNISLRQVLTVLISAGIFFLAIRITSAIFPISTLFAVLLWSWIPISGLALAFIPKNGSPLEEHLSTKLQFLMSDREFVLMDTENDFIDFDETDWQEVESRQWR